MFIFLPPRKQKLALEQTRKDSNSPIPHVATVLSHVWHLTPSLSLYLYLYLPIPLSFLVLWDSWARNKDTSPKKQLKTLDPLYGHCYLLPRKHRRVNCPPWSLLSLCHVSCLPQQVTPSQARPDQARPTNKLVSDSQTYTMTIYYFLFLGFAFFFCPSRSLFLGSPIFLSGIGVWKWSLLVISEIMVTKQMSRKVGGAVVYSIVPVTRHCIYHLRLRLTASLPWSLRSLSFGRRLYSWLRLHAPGQKVTTSRR